MGSALYKQMLERLQSHERDYFTTEELADALEMNRNSIYLWHKKGDLVGVRVGRHGLRFGKQDAIDHFIAMQEVQHRPRKASPSPGDGDGR